MGGGPIDQQPAPVDPQIEAAAESEALPLPPSENPFEAGMYALPTGCNFLTPAEHGALIDDYSAWGPYFDRRFGGNVLLQQRAVDQFGTHSPQGVHVRQQIAPALAYCRQLLQVHAADPASTTMLDRYPLSSELWSVLEAIPGSSRVEKLTKVRDDHLIQFIEWNGRLIDYSTEQRAAELAPPIAAFRARLSRAILQQHLPLDHDMAMARVDQAVVAFADPLIMGPKLKGRTSTVSGTVSVNFDILDPTQLRKTVFHELLHRVAGKAIALQHPAKLQGLVVARDGLAVFAPSKERMRWANEALAYLLTDVFLDSTIEPNFDFRTASFTQLSARYNQQADPYDGRLLLPGVLEGPHAEVSSYHLLEAFFEDYDPHMPAGERSPKQRQLYGSFEQAWGKFDIVQPYLYDPHTPPDDNPDYYLQTLQKIQRLSGLLRKKGR